MHDGAADQHDMWRIASEALFVAAAGKPDTPSSEPLELVVGPLGVAAGPLCLLRPDADPGDLLIGVSWGDDDELVFLAVLAGYDGSLSILRHIQGPWSEVLTGYAEFVLRAPAGIHVPPSETLQ